MSRRTPFWRLYGRCATANRLMIKLIKYRRRPGGRRRTPGGKVRRIGFARVGLRKERAEMQQDRQVRARR